MRFRRLLHSKKISLSLLWTVGALVVFFKLRSFQSASERANVVGGAQKLSDELYDWEDYEYYKRDRRRVGAGENGHPFSLPRGEWVEKEKEELYKVNGFNALVSDYIALNRSVPDVRVAGCVGKLYHARLPLTSVIIPFHNEHLSVLLRTVHSIVNRTPAKLLKEIVLTDDFSDKQQLKGPLDEYVQEHWPHLVKVVRASKREGLIRARLLGAKRATGAAFVFLDSHSECNYNWLPPLLDPIVLNYRTVVCPFVDVIEQSNFQYKIQDNGARGSWDWQFYYKRLPLLAEDLAHPDRPFKSPVMAGGYFAISADWFWQLGGYDDGLDVWGGEQYELSFKIWMCGGELIDAPCSHVGHIYRKFSPISNAGAGDHVSRNYVRVAEVWMDEYKEYLYMRRPHYRSVDPGDLTKQKELRKRLNCKSFKWFMEEIAFDQPLKYPPIEPPNLFKGKIRHVQSGLCVDVRPDATKAQLNDCANGMPGARGQQVFLLTSQREIKPNGMDVCFDVFQFTQWSVVNLFSCHSMGGNQLWNYNRQTGLIRHEVSNMCLQGIARGKQLLINRCNASDESQRWQFAPVL